MGKKRSNVTVLQSVAQIVLDVRDTTFVRFKTEHYNIHTSLIGGEVERDRERGSTLGDGGDAAVVADSREEPRQGG